MDPVRSNLDGKMYDSKRELRRTYKEGGVTEIGNDGELYKSRIYDKKAEKEKRRKEIRAATDRAFSQMGYGAR